MTSPELRHQVETVGEVLSAAIDRLSAAGVDSSRLDAEVLMESATGMARADLIADPTRELDAEGASSFEELLSRRCDREPVAYILGRKGFRSIELSCDPRALIPRPETELLVETAIGLTPKRVLDLGTGTGAIALAIADELPDCDLVATDTSGEALSLARENARDLGLADRVRFEPGSVPADERFDLLVANLPYVSEGEWETLEPELKRWEPREALVAGGDGLGAFRGLLGDGGDLSRLAAPPDAIALEVGLGQAEPVASLVVEAGYGEVGIRKDFSGIDRVVVGRLDC